MRAVGGVAEDGEAAGVKPCVRAVEFQERKKRLKRALEVSLCAKVLTKILRSGGPAREGGCDNSRKARYDTLTPREREVMAQVVSGKLNKQIAGDLGAVERTVKAHRAHIMEKMQVVSLADLVRVAEQLGVPVVSNQ